MDRPFRFWLIVLALAIAFLFVFMLVVTRASERRAIGLRLWSPFTLTRNSATSSGGREDDDEGRVAAQVPNRKLKPTLPTWPLVSKREV